MTQTEYEQKKRECWEEFCQNNPAYDLPYCHRIYDIAFDRAYAIGKQEGAGTVSFKRSLTYVIGDNVHVVKTGKNGMIVAVSPRIGYYVSYGDGSGGWYEEADLTNNILARYISEVRRRLGEQKPTEPKYQIGQIVNANGVKFPFKIQTISTKDGELYLYTLLGLPGIFTEYELSPVTKIADDGNVDSGNVDSSEPKPAEPDTSHETPVCENHSDNTAQKEANVNSNRNLSQNIADCDKQFDNILKDSLRNERRLNVAVKIMSGIMSNQAMMNNLASGESTIEGVIGCIVDAALMYTDALLAKFEEKTI